MLLYLLPPDGGLSPPLSLGQRQHSQALSDTGECRCAGTYNRCPQQRRMVVQTQAILGKAKRLHNHNACHGDGSSHLSQKRRRTSLGSVSVRRMKDTTAHVPRVGGPMVDALPLDHPHMELMWAMASFIFFVSHTPLSPVPFLSALTRDASPLRDGGE